MNDGQQANAVLADDPHNLRKQFVLFNRNQVGGHEIVDRLVLHLNIADCLDELEFGNDADRPAVSIHYRQSTDVVLQQKLDGLADVIPPDDFVAAVMGRVAQHPVHRPGKALQWRAAMRYGVAAAVVLAVVLGGGVTWMLGSGTLQNAQPGAVVAVGISSAAGMAAGVFAATRDLVGQAFVVLEAVAQILWRVTLLAASAGWMVQITLLLLTVSLNYAFTRLVLNYQRRD